jgi:hypothetical protein
MTEEEKRMVMQFMGQTYGEVKKQDSMLVNQSGNLQPKSEEMKQAFAQMAKQPTQQDLARRQAPPRQPEPQVQPPPVAQAPVDYEQAVKELAQTDQIVQQPIVSEQVQDPNQLTFDLKERSVMDELLEASKKTNLLLKDIKLLLEKENGRPAKKKATSKKPG